MRVTDSSEGSLAGDLKPDQGMSHVGSANICLVNSVPEAEVCAVAKAQGPGYLVWFFRVGGQASVR